MERISIKPKLTAVIMVTIVIVLLFNFYSIDMERSRFDMMNGSAAWAVISPPAGARLGNRMFQCCKIAIMRALNFCA